MRDTPGRPTAPNGVGAPSPSPAPARALAGQRLLARIALVIAGCAVAASAAAWLAPASTSDIVFGVYAVPVLLAFPAWALMLVMLLVEAYRPGVRGDPFAILRLLRFVPAWMVLAVLAVAAFASFSVTRSVPDGSGTIRNGEFTIMHDRGTRAVVVDADTYAAHRRREARFMTAFFLVFACPPAIVATAAYRRSRALASASGERGLPGAARGR